MSFDWRDLRGRINRHRAVAIGTALGAWIVFMLLGDAEAAKQARDQAAQAGVQELICQIAAAAGATTPTCVEMTIKLAGDQSFGADVLDGMSAVMVPTVAPQSEPAIDPPAAEEPAGVVDLETRIAELETTLAAEREDRAAEFQRMGYAIADAERRAAEADARVNEAFIQANLETERDDVDEVCIPTERFNAWRSDVDSVCSSLGSGGGGR